MNPGGQGRDAWAVVAAFEQAVAAYTGAPEAVTVDSCTNALGLCLRWRKKTASRCGAEPHSPRECRGVSLPRRTYVGVAMQALHAGFRVEWRDEDWTGDYELEPWGVWDAARRFERGMYRPGTLHCVSFHIGKVVRIGRGGAILTDDPEAAAWFRRMRHDGRTPGVPTEQDTITEAGFHCAMSPDEAARGLWALEWIGNGETLPNEHTDISGHPVFR